MELPENSSPEKSSHDASTCKKPSHRAKTNRKQEVSTSNTAILDAIEGISGLVLGVIGVALSDAGFHLWADVCYFVAVWSAISVIEHRTQKLSFPGRKLIYWLLMVSTPVLFGFLFWHSYQSEHQKPAEITNSGEWQPPQFATNCEQITFFLGEGLSIGGAPSSYANPKDGQGLCSLADGEKPIRVRVNDRRIYVDLDIAVFGFPFITNVAVRGSSISKLPPFWHLNNCTDAIEIVDGQYTPIYQVWYETAERVHINGIFWSTNQSAVISYGNHGNSTLPSDANATWLGLAPIFKYPVRADSPCDKR